jgi:hypothetical protein
MLDDVEGEIVEPTERPNRDGQKQKDSDIPSFQKEKRRGQQSEAEKEKAFGNDERRVFEISHESALPLKSDSLRGFAFLEFRSDSFQPLGQFDFKTAKDRAVISPLDA